MRTHSSPSVASSRRDMLCRSAAGFGLLGLAGATMSSAAPSAFGSLTSEGTHFPAKARRVIFLFMNGAPSHVDTFDPKPELAKVAGEKPSGKLFKDAKAGYLPSPFRFYRHGQSGIQMSELFPRLARHADDLCVLRGMHTDVPNHEPGLLLMSSGHQQPVRPSFGSWASYGLGSENANLPSFVVLCPGRPVVGPQLWSSGFLPGQFQGVSVDTNHTDVNELIANLNHPTRTRDQQRKQLDLIQRLNRLHQTERPEDPRLESHIQSLETAFQMQREATDAFDLKRESLATQVRYGDTPYGRSCLLARRLVERGVRFIQVYYVDKGNKQPWDTHSNNDGGHRRLCADSDQGTAALLHDLKERGLLDDTLVIWGGEFGRTPYAQVNDNDKQKPGRDHHHTGFSMFLAGGGVRSGLTYGATDEFGMNAVEGRMHVHDLHATVLHLMGIDHTKLTYRYSGRDFRLTDVHGRVVKEICDT
ncbi:MAG: DUF1501 domain-containing protein [Planctomycetales bacterium]|nr:DUF1501 domain-containing protein [Planctomycetales bacterium]